MGVRCVHVNVTAMFDMCYFASSWRGSICAYIILSMFEGVLYYLTLHREREVWRWP